MLYVFANMARGTKQIDPTCLWLADTQFSHSGAQCAAVESKDFCSPVFAAYLPMGLLKYPNNMVVFNLFQCFLGPCSILVGFLQFIHQAQFGP